MPAEGARWVRPLLLWVVPVAVAVGIGAYWLSQQHYASTDNAYVKADKTLVAAEVDGRVKRVLALENAPVEAGQVLLELDDETLRYALERARAVVEARRVEVAGLKAQYAQKAAELELARRTARFAGRERAREQEMARAKLVALSKLDSAEQASEEAGGRVAVAERDLAAIAARLGGRVDLPVDEHAEVRAARSDLAQAELDLRHARLVAPRDGIVSRLPQVGDHLARGAAALAIVSTRRVWIEANFKETDLAHVREGQPVRIEVDTYAGHDWQGRLESIAQATGAEFSILPPQNASGNWVKVVQRIPVRIAVLTTPEDPPLRAGMSASVRIDTSAAPMPASAAVPSAGPRTAQAGR